MELFAFGNTAHNLDAISYLLDFLWDVFQVIDMAIQNKLTRQYLIDTVRIITGISNFAVKVSTLLVEVSEKLNEH